MLLANKVDRILESIKANTGIDSYNNIVAAFDVLDLKATPNKQANMLNK